MEGDRNGTGKVQLPGLREDQSDALAPFHVIARGWAGPSLLAMILFEKFGQHQPLNRQAERLCTRRRADQPVDDGRRRPRSGCGRARPGAPAGRGPCHGGQNDLLTLGDDHDRVPRCWPKARPTPAWCWSLCARRSAVRRPQAAGGDVLITPATAKASTRSAIWPDTPGCSRPMPLTAIARIYLPQRHACRCDPGGRGAGRIARRPFFAMADIAENARRRAAGKERGRTPRRSRSRSCAASTPCSRSSGRSTARARRRAQGRSARSGASRLSKSFRCRSMDLI